MSAYLAVAAALNLAIAKLGDEPIMAAKIVGEKPHITGLSSDTRTLQAGDLFFALGGENFDGHRFVEPAIALGASGAVVNKTWFEEHQPKSGCFFVVDDVLTAYQNLATWWRSQCQLPVIAITGSAGKTTTKEIISKLLGFYGTVHKSLANHNNDIGVTQTLLSINPKIHNFVVVEMGMRGLGEIARLATVARPDVAVITNIGTAHIGRLGSQEAIAQAKCELLEYMPKAGTAILNGEDHLLMARAAKVWSGTTITYGIEAGDVQGAILDQQIQVEDQVWQLPLHGRHNAMNFLAGLAVVKALVLNWQSISADLGNLDLPTGRAQIYQVDQNITILDETYNSSPEAAIAALHLLAQIPTTNRRWAVLGTMKELGEMSEILHRKVGSTVKDLGIDCLLVLTDGESDAILTGAGHNFKYLGTGASHQDLCQILLTHVQAGDTILFKASHSVAMQKVLQGLGWLK